MSSARHGFGDQGAHVPWQRDGEGRLHPFCEAEGCERQAGNTGCPSCPGCPGSAACQEAAFCPCKCSTSLPEQRQTVAAVESHDKIIVTGYIFFLHVYHLEIYIFFSIKSVLSSTPNVKRESVLRALLRLQIDHSLPDPYLTRM